MKTLGYYAKDKDNNLFQFRWKFDDTFEILLNSEWVKRLPKDYEILEIGYFEAIHA